jgi:hypothetical protein
MKRVGYDSDSGRYYFRDREGVLYEGGEGAEFGEMTRGVFPPTTSRYLFYFIYYFDIPQYLEHQLRYLKKPRMKTWKQHRLEQMGTNRSQQNL